MLDMDGGYHPLLFFWILLQWNLPSSYILGMTKPPAADFPIIYNRRFLFSLTV